MPMTSKEVILTYDAPLTVSLLGQISDTVRGMYLEQRLSADAKIDISEDRTEVVVVVKFTQDGLD